MDSLEGLPTFSADPRLHTSPRRSQSTPIQPRSAPTTPASASKSKLGAGTPRRTGRLSDATLRLFESVWFNMAMAISYLWKYRADQEVQQVCVVSLVSWSEPCGSHAAAVAPVNALANAHRAAVAVHLRPHEGLRRENDRVLVTATHVRPPVLFSPTNTVRRRPLTPARCASLDAAPSTSTCQSIRRPTCPASSLRSRRLSWSARADSFGSPPW